MEWQLIELAPHDETILIYGVGESGPEIHTAKWDGGWWESYAMDRAFDFEPSHWMALPRAPVS